MVMDFAVALFDHFGSGLLDAVPAMSVDLPVKTGLNVTVKVFDARDDNELVFQVTTLCHHDWPLLVETSFNEYGKARPTHTFFAVAGPEFFTVTLHDVVAPTLALLGHDTETDRSAFVDAGGGDVTVTVNGPAVAAPAGFVATTE
jgi:hypothetical protein